MKQPAGEEFFRQAVLFAAPVHPGGIYITPHAAKDKALF
jgi:hypothetical protein